MGSTPQKIRRVVDPLIGVCGAIGSGKDSVADHLVERYGFVKLSFADKLKRLCMDLFQLEWKHVFGTQEEKMQAIVHLNVVPPECGLMGDPWPERVGEPWCGRWVLEWMGTNACRTVWSPVWVEAVRREVQASRESAGHNGQEYRAVISDVRFENEARMIWQLGGLVLRTEVEGSPVQTTGHSSDAWYPTAKVDFILVAPKPGLSVLRANADYVMARFNVGKI